MRIRRRRRRVICKHRSSRTLKDTSLRRRISQAYSQVSDAYPPPQRNISESSAAAVLAVLAYHSAAAPAAAAAADTLD